ncbi:MAG: DUF1656 domain-containing protein [Caulobacteraceae bacterium]|nr:DUF1656 domain-containing protein [Caulobacteraceae bacterium]
MRAELDINGVFVPSLLVLGVVAWLLTAVAARVLARVGVYKLVWHRALFDLALFVVVWGAVVALTETGRIGGFHT